MVLGGPAGGIEGQTSEGTDAFYSPFQRSTNTTEENIEKILMAADDVTGMNRNNSYKLGSPEQRQAHGEYSQDRRFGINLIAT